MSEQIFQKGDLVLPEYVDDEYRVSKKGTVWKVEDPYTDSSIYMTITRDTSEDYSTGGPPWEVRKDLFIKAPIQLGDIVTTSLYPGEKFKLLDIGFYCENPQDGNNISVFALGEDGSKCILNYFKCNFLERPEHDLFDDGRDLL